MKIVNATIVDNVRVDLNSRAHTFPIQLAIALVETMQYAAHEEEAFEILEGETENGDDVFWCTVGIEAASGSTPQVAVIRFWNLYVQPKKQRQ